MKIKNILISQPAPAAIDKSPFYEIIQKHNLELDFFPLIKVVGVTLKDFRSQRIDILSHTTIVFTSRAMIDNFFRICEESRISVPEGMKYICNSEAIALYLQKYIVYRKRKIFFGDGSFSNFMEVIMKHKDEKFLVAFCEPYKPELANTMEQLGLNFNKAVLASTVSTDTSELDIDKYDMMVMYSTSDIKAIKESFGERDKLPMLATFGNTTSQKAVERGFTINVTAPTPQAPSMVKALDIFIEKFNAGETIAPVVVEEKKLGEEFIKAQAAKPSRRRAAAPKA